MNNEEIKTLIRRRRAQMLVHSYLYYHTDDPIITDECWQFWANNLEQLQTENPKCCKIGFYDKEFKDWDGTTGMHLPSNIIIKQKAEQVSRAFHKLKETENYT
ncbi:NAD-dependent DNA ligase, adenylation [uncultured Caudovirales phage]|uniref:NAD-dependent DNA ligase, adenylation n=1 Tax=uncultured Caudovirales phage TaxID=2100421 RepID=A0A6J5LJD6_9CAUD|nr:NAD-dependent DNA ligase, adenylation [uncultured Caudovirales phage]